MEETCFSHRTPLRRSSQFFDRSSPIRPYRSAVSPNRATSARYSSSNFLTNTFRGFSHIQSHHEDCLRREAASLREQIQTVNLEHQGNVQQLRNSTNRKNLDRDYIDQQCEHLKYQNSELKRRLLMLRQEISHGKMMDQTTAKTNPKQILRDDLERQLSKLQQELVYTKMGAQTSQLQYDVQMRREQAALEAENQAFMRAEIDRGELEKGRLVDELYGWRKKCDRMAQSNTEVQIEIEKLQKTIFGKTVNK